MTTAIALLPMPTASAITMNTAGPQPPQAVFQRSAAGRQNTPVSAMTEPAIARTVGVMPTP